MAKINVDMARALQQMHLTFTLTGIDRATRRFRRSLWLLKVWARWAGIGGVKFETAEAGDGAERRKALAADLDGLERIGTKADRPEGSRVVIMSDTLLRTISGELRGDQPSRQEPAAPPEPPADHRPLWPWRQA